MRAHFMMVFAKQEYGQIKPVEDESTRLIRGQIVQAFAEEGHEVSFKSKDILEVEINDEDEINRIVNKVMERHGCVQCDCREVPSDLFNMFNDHFGFDETDFGFSDEPDFNFGDDLDFGGNYG